MKVLKLATIALWIMVTGQIALSNTQPTVFFREGFETGGTQLPSGWINVAIVNNDTWKVGVGAGPFPPGQSGLPDTAAVGATNAFFRVPSSNPYVSRLISPPINLEFAVNPELRFWHAQVPRDGMHARLGVYIATNINGPWTLIANYSSAVHQWTERTLLLPGGSRTLFVAFEGHSGQGLGGSVCVDEVRIVETGTLQREISGISSIQPSTDFVFTGSMNNQVLNTSIKVIGNTGTLSLGSFTVVSQSTLNDDIAPNGVRLWAGQSESFRNATPVGSPQSLVNGQATFTNLTYSLPTGYTYLWVTFDAATNAQAGNFIDAKLPVGGISVNGQSFPAQEQNPAGNRLIIRTIFLDDFESDRGWNLSGEWQRAAPLGLGGHQTGQGATSGPSDPHQALSGTRVLGTDLTGLGLYPGNYESNLPELAYVAISPEINTFYFSDVMVSFQRWLNVHLFHRATIDISTDNGITWSNIWSNYAVQNTSEWNQVSYPVPSANRKQSVRFRFGLGETGGTNLQSGWNIDDFVVTGTFISTDVGVSQWVTPQSTCNLGPNESVTVVVENFGASPTPPVIPLAFSINNGSTWQRDTLRTSIPVGQSVQFTFGPTANFSTPGNYENIIVRTELTTDQYQGNDTYFTEVFSAPVINIPYNESFEAGQNFWRTYGTNSSMELANPAGTIINSAFSGSMAWVTNSFGAYNAGEVSIIESPCFNFTGILNPVLDLNLNLHTPTGLDGAAIDYSVDGGFTWVRLEPRSHALGWFWYNHSNISGLIAATGNGRGWTGNSNGWFNSRVVLPVILGNQPSVRFRLIFAAQNVFLNFEGVAMDVFRVYPAPPDVGITEITEPVTACTLENNEQVTARVRNMGIDTLKTGTNIPVNLIILNTPINIRENLILANDLAPGQSLLYTFSQTIDLSIPGTYNLTAFTSLPGDIGFFTPGLSNDSLSAEVIHFGLPAIELGMDFYTTRPDTVVLDAGPGMNHYLWQDGSTLQAFNVSSPNSAWYRVTITDHNNCSSTDSIRVKTYDLAITNALDPLSGCQNPAGERVRIELSNTGHDPFPSGLAIPLELYFEGAKIEDLTYELQQPLLPSEHTVVTFNTIVNVAILGQYSFATRHRFRDANASNDSIHWVVNSLGLPTVNIGDTIFTTRPDTLLLDAGAGFASYLWQNGYTGQIFNVSSPFTQTYTVTVTDHQGCSDTDDVVVFTYDASITGIVSPVAGCLPIVPVPVSFTLKNLGVDTFPEGKAFDIAWFLDGDLISGERFLLNTLLLPGDSTAFTFTQFTTIEAPDEYHISVEITSRDAEMANNRFGSIVEFLENPNLQIPSQIVTNRPDTVVLNAGPGHISYLWDNGHTAQTRAVSDFGLYSVTVGNANGCFTSGTILVVPELPDMGVQSIVSPTGGCLDDYIEVPVSINLINSGNVVVPEGSQISLQYSLNGTLVSTQELILSYTLKPGEILPFTFIQETGFNAVGEDTLIVRLNYVNDSRPENDSLVQIVEVFPMPEVNLPDSIISANPIGLVLQPNPGYASYLWQDGSTAPTFTIASPLSQWYRVTVTNSQGCSTTDSVFVLAWDLAVTFLLNPRSNCVLSSEEQVTFVLQNMGPDIFYAGHIFRAGFSIGAQPVNWQHFTLASNLNPMAVRTFSFNQKANLAATGAYQVRIILEGKDVNMDNNSLLANILVPGAPVVNLGNDINTMRPDTVVLDAGAGFASYLWNNGSTTRLFNVVNFGRYFVEVQDQFGCRASDTINVNNATSVPSREFFENSIHVFPNPATDIVTVQIDNNIHEWRQLELINQTGSVIFRSIIDSPGLLQKKVNVGDLQPGVFYIRITGINASVVRKLIVQRRD